MATRLNRITLWTKSHFPHAYRIVRPVGRALMRLKRPPDRRQYWEQRKHMNYYREVIRLAKVKVPSGSAVIDVGSGDTDVLESLPWFGRRVALDLYPVSPKAGIETIQADFFEYRSSGGFDLVLCLQVLEHLEAPDAFARKLFEIGQTVIISVPYRWSEDACIWHLQDPVDEAKLEGWTGRKPVEVHIVSDERERMIAVYRNDGTPYHHPA